jgi:hypothetical protein
MDSPADKLYGARAEALEGLKGYCAESVSGATVVLPKIVGILAGGSVARGAPPGRHTGRPGVNERDDGEHHPEPRWKVAVEYTAAWGCLGVRGGAIREYRPSRRQAMPW